MRAQQVVCPQRRMRMMSAKVDGTGTAALSGTCANNLTLTDNGTGDYTIGFKTAFRQAPEVFLTPVTDDRIALVSSVSESSVRVFTQNLSGSPADADFHIVILGSDSQDQI